MKDRERAVMRRFRYRQIRREKYHDHILEKYYIGTKGIIFYLSIKFQYGHPNFWAFDLIA